MPLSHEKTLAIFEWYFHDAHSTKTRERAAKAIGFSDTVQKEDVHICEALQRGLQPVTYDRGRCSVKRENAVYHFYMLLGEISALEAVSQTARARRAGLRSFRKKLSGEVLVLNVAPAFMPAPLLL